MDVIEAITGAMLGFITGMAANQYILPLFGFYPNWGQSFKMAIAFFMISFIMRYVIRKLFRKLE